MIQEIEAALPEKLAFLFQPARYKVAWGGRGGAKSWGFSAALILLASMRTLRIVCARELQKSIDGSVHSLLKDTINRLSLSSHYRVHDTYIECRNGSEFSFHGLKHNVTSIKSFEGADIVWVEEAEAVSADSWETLIPTVRKDYKQRGEPQVEDHICSYVGCCSEIWVSYNPKLESGETHKRFVIDPPKSAVVVKIGWRDNPWFPDTLRAEKDELLEKDPKAYARIWEGECQSAAEGAIYADELKETTDSGRLCSVPIDRTRPVHTFWDLGFGDKTAIWLAQSVQGWYHLVDYLEGSQKTINHYVIELQQRQVAGKYIAGIDWLPHDAIDAIIHQKLGGGDKTRSIEMLMRASGRRVRIAPKLHVTSGINAARTIFPQCRFDADRCMKGLDGLKNYQWGPPAKSGAERTEPLHDWASHPADGFRTFAVAMKHPPPPEEQAPAPSMPTSEHSWMA